MECLRWYPHAFYVVGPTIIYNLLVALVSDFQAKRVIEPGRMQQLEQPRTRAAGGREARESEPADGGDGGARQPANATARAESTSSPSGASRLRQTVVASTVVRLLKHSLSTRGSRPFGGTVAAAGALPPADGLNGAPAAPLSRLRISLRRASSGLQLLRQLHSDAPDAHGDGRFVDEHDLHACQRYAKVDLASVYAARPRDYMSLEAWAALLDGAEAE